MVPLKKEKAAFSTATEKRLENGGWKIPPCPPPRIPTKWNSRVVTRKGLLIPGPGMRSENGLSGKRLGEGRANLTSPAGAGGCCRTKGGRVRPRMRGTSGPETPARAWGRGPEGGPAGTGGQEGWGVGVGTGEAGPGLRRWWGRGLRATAFFSKREGAEAEFPPREEKAAVELVTMEV